MYESFFGLREPPFDLTANPRFLILTPSHSEALANLVYGLTRRAGLTVLIGEAGTGKTTLLRAALERQAEDAGCVYLNNPTLTRGEFVEFLATRFGLSMRAGGSKGQFLVELEEHLRQRSEANRPNVLIIDEAQSLPYELLEEVRLLANMETSDTKLLSVVLAGQPELTGRLDEPQLRQLKQRVALRCELQPLTVSETATYISHRVHVAGGVATEIFTREAVVLIHRRAQGIPRTISVICDNALVTAFALEQRPVTCRIIEDVCRDFAVRESPSSSAPPGTTQRPAADMRLPDDPAGVPKPDEIARFSAARRWFQASVGSLRFARSVDRGSR